MNKIYLAENSNSELKTLLESLGKKATLVAPRPSLPAPLACHPDLTLCKLDSKADGPIFCGADSKLNSKYPYDCIYNGAATGKYFLHKTSITDSLLLSQVTKMGMEIIDIPQGYGKCNICVVNEDTIITSDEGIAKACQGTKLTVCLIHKGHISLPGYSYGFIGGASGLVDDTMIFNGDLSQHPDYIKIREVIEGCGKKCIFTKGYPLTDIGSIIQGELL